MFLKGKALGIKFKYNKIPVKLPKLKESIAPAAKLYNWNTVQELYKTVDVKI